jgi:S-DNA-T family DNA segregation ATPase FtsK/SpoIIIE
VCPVAPLVSALDPITLGMGEDGRAVTLELGSAAHLIVQGTTGGGKSIALYSLLGQLVDAPDVRVTGCDPTGLLLRPWSGRWADIPAPALGTADPARYVLMLDQVVREMDRRIAAMPAGRDSVALSTDMPVLLVVLEEYPGLLRLVDGTDAKLGKQLRALVGRLLAEGRKAGVRVVIVSQRADASILGGFERGQASHRLSFRVDSGDAVRMLHPDALPDVIAAHAAAPAGVALLTAPGLPLTRLRAPWRTYADYCAAVGGPGPAEGLRVVS